MGTVSPCSRPPTSRLVYRRSCVVGFSAFAMLSASVFIACWGSGIARPRSERLAGMGVPSLVFGYVRADASVATVGIISPWRWQRRLLASGNISMRDSIMMPLSYRGIMSRYLPCGVLWWEHGDAVIHVNSDGLVPIHTSQIDRAGRGIAVRSLAIHMEYRTGRILGWIAPTLWLLWVAGRIHGWLRIRRAHQQGRCVQCGYDLRATPERCPECGTLNGGGIHAVNS